MKKLFLLAGFATVLAAAVAAPAQDAPPVAAQISEFVRRIHQDGQGRMWFGTNGDGVVLYDGE